jgi:hypothetical protein
MNMYAYVGGDPLNLVDPSGEEAECDSSGSNCVDKVEVVGERNPIRKQQAEQRERADRASSAMAGGAIAIISRAAPWVAPPLRVGSGLLGAMRAANIASGIWDVISQVKIQDLVKVGSNKGADDAARAAGYKDAHDAKKKRGDSKVDIYKDRTTGKYYIWDGNKNSEPEEL